MTARELIIRYSIVWVDNDKIAVPGGKRLPKTILEEIKNRKDEILAELKAMKDEEESRRQAEVARREAEREAIRTGKQKIVVRFHETEYLGGYRVTGEAAALLAHAKLCSYVDGWGFIVDSDVVEALGEEFTYQEALEFAKSRKTGQEDGSKPPSFQDLYEQKLTEAKSTGQPVILGRWTERCNAPQEECSLDIVIEWVHPDGKTSLERIHTW